MSVTRKTKPNTLRWVLIALVVVAILAVGVALIATQGSVNSTNDAFNALETQRATD